jgi:hypothetical protein
MIRTSAIQMAYRNVMAGLAMVTLCQCALPPGSAWSVIRKDGFKDYLAISWGKKPVPEYVKEMLPEAFGRSPETEVTDGVDQQPDGAASQALAGTGDEGFPALPSEMPEDWTRPVEPVFPLMSTDPPEFPSLTPPVVASYGTPNPPLLPTETETETETETDEFAQVSIPEFLNLSAPPVTESSQGLPQKPAPGLKMKYPIAPAVATEGKGKTQVTNGVDEGQVAAVVQQDQVKKSVGVPEVESTQKAAAEGKTVADTEIFLPTLTPGPDEATVPFGAAVSGRPGYVRSPFAMSHQVVDVSGFKVGDAVKCPFSGRFFRVPAVQEAMSRATTEGAKGEEIADTKAGSNTAPLKGSSDKPQ